MQNGGVTGTLRDDIDDLVALTEAVTEELRELRAAHGVLTVQKFAQAEALRRVCGGGDLLDAFLMFEREMKRYQTTGNRDEAAAAISITAPADNVLDRLEHVVGALPQDGRIRDQRTGRRWSDDGIPIIARALVHLAEVQGRLGTELLTLELSGTLDDGLRLDIYQLTTKTLEDTAPAVRVWRYTPDGDITEASSEIEFTLDEAPATEAVNEEYRAKHHQVQIELPEGITRSAAEDGDPLYSISVESRDAPMRTVSFTDESQLAPTLSVRFTTYRTVATIELLRSSA